MPDKEKIRRALALAADIPLDELAGFLAEAQSEYEFWRHARDAAEHEILQRMDDNEASQLPSDHWLIKRKPAARAYEWDIESLTQARQYVPAADWDAAVQLLPPQYKVNATRVKAWAKYGARVAAILEESYACKPRGADRVELEPRHEMEREPVGNVSGGLRGGHDDYRSDR